MKPDVLKSAWEGLDKGSKTSDELRRMMQEKKHPVLKRIRRQMIIETIAFIALLVVYYDFFDGNQKPLYINIILVAGVLAAILHNIIGYKLTSQYIQGHNLKQSLERYLRKIKSYANISVASRALTGGCLLAFFSSMIIFNTSKYWILGAIVLVFIMQLMLLTRIWKERIRVLKSSIDSFE